LLKINNTANIVIIYRLHQTIRHI